MLHEFQNQSNILLPPRTTKIVSCEISQILKNHHHEQIGKTPTLIHEYTRQTYNQYKITKSYFIHPKFQVLFAAIVGVAFCEPPPNVGYGAPSATTFESGGASSGFGSATNEYVDEALLARVAELYNSGGDGSGGQQDNEASQYVDAALFARVSQALDSGSSRSSGNGSPSSSYGPPARQSSGQSTLGAPEPAERIAMFDLMSAIAQAAAAPAPSYQQAPQASSYQPAQRASSGQISLGSPQAAPQVANFDLNQAAAPRSSYSAPDASANNGGQY